MATSHSKVSKALRFEILRRDNFRCHYCGSEAAQTDLHVDHVVPQSLGGTNDPSNLVTACAECNSGKAGRTLDEPVLAAVDEKAQRYATAVEQAIAERRQVLTTEQQTKDAFRAEWNCWEPTEPLPAGFGESVLQFMRAGLDWEDIVDSIEIAMSRLDIRGRENGRFKYFCGVCNRKIEDIRNRADEIMGEPVGESIEQDTFLLGMLIEEVERTDPGYGININYALGVRDLANHVTFSAGIDAAILADGTIWQDTLAGSKLEDLRTGEIHTAVRLKMHETAWNVICKTVDGREIGKMPGSLYPLREVSGCHELET
uniref:HNH endonuclease n=1 Tax=Corynebacterium phage HS01 TaxID=3056389 RepID=A0AA49X1W0_9VIRU|nr:MAG: HNH endonuclease [Corynebacterium phage HS01]